MTVSDRTNYKVMEVTEGDRASKDWQLEYPHHIYIGAIMLYDNARKA